VISSQIRDLREELNWYYTVSSSNNSARGKVAKGSTIAGEAHSHEKELLKTLRELPARRGKCTLEAPADFSLKKLQASLPGDATLIEYFSAGTHHCRCHCAQRNQKFFR